MYRNDDKQLVFSPTDLIRFMESPFASWMERFRLERPDDITRDEPSEEMKLIARTGDAHASLRMDIRNRVERTWRLLVL